MSTPTTSLSDVTPEDAYLAARDRALRTADALIGEEAKVRSLTRQLDEQIRANAALVAENARLSEQLAPAKEVDHAEESGDAPGYLAAVGQAD